VGTHFILDHYNMDKNILFAKTPSDLVEPNLWSPYDLDCHSLGYFTDDFKGQGDLSLDSIDDWVIGLSKRPSFDTQTMTSSLTALSIPSDEFLSWSPVPSELECGNHSPSFSHQGSLSPVFSNHTSDAAAPSLEHEMYQPCPQIPHQEGQRESRSLDLKQTLQIPSSNMPSLATNSSSNVPILVSKPVSMMPMSHSPGLRDTGRVAATRSAHNIVEKRYRTNLNAKFAALERVLQGGARSTGDQYSSPKRPVKGRGAVGPRKSELLENAVIYIQELRGEKKRLLKELDVLKDNFLAASIRRGSQTHRSGRSNFSDRNGTKKEN